MDDTKKQKTFCAQFANLGYTWKNIPQWKSDHSEQQKGKQQLERVA
ncbi:hypothetical protein ACFOEQ_00820 [Chryseobacterium arachidis]